MKLPADHSMNKFKLLLQSIGSTGGLFDETTQRGQRFAKLVSNIVEDIFKPFGGITLSNANSLIDRLLDSAEALELRFRDVMSKIKDGVGDFIGNAKASLLDLAAEIGVAIGKGLYLAVQRAVNNLPIVGSGLSDADAAAQTKRGLGIVDFYSKGSTKGVTSTAIGSSLFAKGTIAGGLYDALGGSRDVPSMASGGIVPGPAGAPVMVQMHGGEVVPGLRGEYMGAAMAKYGGGGGVTINVYQTITGGGDAMEAAQQSVQGRRQRWIDTSGGWHPRGGLMAAVTVSELPVADEDPVAWNVIFIAGKPCPGTCLPLDGERRRDVDHAKEQGRVARPSNRQRTRPDRGFDQNPHRGRR